MTAINSKYLLFLVDGEYIHLAKPCFCPELFYWGVSGVGVQRMATDHVEPFQRALAELRERLREGGFPPGTRIAATEVADTLKLSATPVREALSRLAGEGLLEDRRGQGFFLRPLSGVDIADLYRLGLTHLTIAQDSHRERVTRQGVEPVEARSEALGNPVRYIERLFMDWVAEAGSRALTASYRTLQTQLGPVRRFEAAIIEDLAPEAIELVALSAPDLVAARLPLIRKFHARRIGLADRLAALAYQEPEAPKV
ncbi:GntR family transcriptional regulator [Phenylobacterium sp.]|uniref:GntR family transcriptional regulator n=1 Tax=Phenylobacterium sp. TaxID=1871053 RepID=UPI003565E531